MIITAGGYSHVANTAWIDPLVIRRMPSQRGRTLTYSHRWNINFFLYGTTVSALDTKVAQVKSAYNNITSDVVLKDNSGVATSHRIPYASTLNGIRATLVWPKSWIGSPTGTNWATHVYGIAQVEAEVVSVEDNILLYYQSMQYSLGGVGYEVVESFTGIPQIQFNRQMSKFWAIQRGTAIGAFINPNPADPLVAAPVHPHKSWVRHHTPKMQGTLQNLAFATDWNYYFESPLPLNAVPPANP